MCVNNLSKVALDSAAVGIEVEPAISSRKSNALAAVTNVYSHSHVTTRWKLNNTVNSTSTWLTWRSSFPVAPARLWSVEHSDAARHVSIVNIGFQETFKDPSL